MENDKFYKIILKAICNMSVVSMVNKLEKNTRSLAVKYKINYEKLEIHNLNEITSEIRDSVIRNKYKKVYKI